MLDPINYLVDLCHETGYKSVRRENLQNSNIILVFDEAQQSYRDFSLWLGLIKTRSGTISGPRICLFSSYGSPDSGSSEYLIGSTPINLSPAQRVTITPSRIPGSPQIALFSTTGMSLKMLWKEGVWFRPPLSH